MVNKVTRIFKTALKTIRKEQKVSLQELGLRIDSDASHIYKIENGQDVALSTLLKLANALDVTVTFGQYTITIDKTVKQRTRRKC